MLPRFPNSTLLIALACSVTLAGCSSDGPIKAIAEAGGLATSVAEPKPFVVEARQANSEYIPIQPPAVAVLCAGPNTPPPPVLRSGRSTFVSGPAPACRPRFDFKSLEGSLEERRTADANQAETAKALGKVLPPPAPPPMPPPL